MRFSRTIKSVVSDILPYSRILPAFPVSVLIPQSVVFRQWMPPQILETVFFWQGIFLSLMIVAGMLSLAALEIVCGSNFENEPPLGIDIVADIKPFFPFWRIGVLDNLSPLFYPRRRFSVLS